MNNKIYCLIPARGGSKEIKLKNIRYLNGKPLIIHTIEKAIKSGKFDRIDISTDSNLIIDTISNYDVYIPYIRPKKLSGDKVTLAEVINYHKDYLLNNKIANQDDYLVILQPTSPTRTLKSIEHAITMMSKKKIRLCDVNERITSFGMV